MASNGLVDLSPAGFGGDGWGFRAPKTKKQGHSLRVAVHGQVSTVISLLHNQTAKNQKRK